METFDEFVQLIRNGNFDDSEDITRVATDLDEAWHEDYLEKGEKTPERRQALANWNLFNFLARILRCEFHFEMVGGLGSYAPRIRIALCAIREAGLLPDGIANQWSEFLKAEN